MLPTRTLSMALTGAWLALGATAFARDAVPEEPPSRRAPSGSSRAARSVPRVILLGAPETLARALRTALRPWGMTLESRAGDTPEPTLPGTALQAGELAREMGAEVLVWISANDDGAALWIYEASKETVRARPFPDRPLDEALAAALALSVKTWLLSPTVVEPEPAPPPPDDDAAAPMATPAAAPLSPPARAVAPDQLEPPTPSTSPRSQLVVFTALRLGARQPREGEPRHGVEVRAAPWLGSGGSTGLWLGARLETGQAEPAENVLFRGTHYEWGGGFSIGVVQHLAPTFKVGLHAGPAFSRTRVSGTLLSDATAAETSHWGAAGVVRPELELSLGPAGLLLQTALGVPLRRERYTADELELLRTRSLWWMLGGAVRVDLF